MMPMDMCINILFPNLESKHCVLFRGFLLSVRSHLVVMIRNRNTCGGLSVDLTVIDRIYSSSLRTLVSPEKIRMEN